MVLKPARTDTPASPGHLLHQPHHDGSELYVPVRAPGLGDVIPVRLFVPGWGGIASTKWVIGIEGIDHVFPGRLNTDSYTIIDEFERKIRPVREMLPPCSTMAAPWSTATWAATASRKASRLGSPAPCSTA